MIYVNCWSLREAEELLASLRLGGFRGYVSMQAGYYQLRYWK